MKFTAKTVIALLLVLLTAAALPARVFADSGTEYIAEVKIGMADNPDDAAAALEGYTILTDDNGEYVDLNEDAGGGFGSKGDKVVYLGYTTTDDSNLALTDLALMNMKGGYSVQEYEALMEKQMKSQIIPFVDRFISAIKEYRENFDSDYPLNKARALRMHDLLNKLTDDDTGMALGDLFLNETKYELGDAAYNALSAEEKKNHADILTLIAQANGQATLSVFKLITLASDTNEQNWIERFSGLTYDDLIDETDKSPTDAEAELDRMYYDTACAILKSWADFREQLINADNAEEDLYEAAENGSPYTDNLDEFSEFDLQTATDEEIEECAADLAGTLAEAQIIASDITDLAAKAYLEGFEYGDGTLFDFFTRTEEDLNDNIRELYPLCAVLTPGQISGLDYVSLSEMLMMAGTENFDDESFAEFDRIESESVYYGVDRAIYEKGGVALTSDALRTKASEIANENRSMFGALTWIMFGITAASAIAFGSSVFIAKSMSSSFRAVDAAREAFYAGRHKANLYYIADCRNLEHFTNEGNQGLVKYFSGRVNSFEDNLAKEYGVFEDAVKWEKASARSATATRLSVGIGIAMIVLTAYTTYLTYRDMVNYYKVDFTPIPHYMVDEQDITAYNEAGDKIVLKNQSAYYKAVECNRNPDDEFYDILGTCADMNGDVGKQWLALYAVSSDTGSPLIASSLKAVTDNNELPAGYNTGIHMFGSSSAFNLNSSLYDWNSGADSVYVYFLRDSSVQSAAASGANFTSGTLAISAGAGLILGVSAVAAVIKLSGMKKKERAA